MADIAVVDRGAEGAVGSGAIGRLSIFTGRTQIDSLSAADAHRTILNSDAAIRGFAAQVDTMHPDLWLDEPTLQIISLTAAGAGGPNQAESVIEIRMTNGQAAGSKGVRPTLVLAGDVNLDGKVDALDLQESIDQLGSNPQAVGVMALADLNADTVVDTDDVALLLQDYGGETDIYEGLWDGSRLLAVVGSNAGFGTIGGGVTGGSGSIGPGRRPADDCDPVLPPAGNQLPHTLVDDLLNMDARNNCDKCPPYTPESEGCYECIADKGVAGGTVTASEAQPFPSEPVTFTVSGVSETPGRLRCTEVCGDDGKTASTRPEDPAYRWAVYRRAGSQDWPQEPDQPYSHWPGGESLVADAGPACEEMKVVCWARPSGRCIPNDPWVRVGEKIVKSADFRVEYSCTADFPENRKRTTLGVGETFTVRAVDENQQLVSVLWTLIIDNGDPSNTSGTIRDISSPGAASNLTVRATSGDCTRTVEFSVIAPEGIAYNRVGQFHTQGQAGSGMCIEQTMLPLTVSFEDLAYQETSYNGIATGAFAGLNGQGHCADANPADGYCDGFSYVNSGNVLEHLDLAGTIGAMPNSDGLYDPGFNLYVISHAYTWNSQRYDFGTPIQQYSVIDFYGNVYTVKVSASVSHGVNSPSENCP